MSEPYRVLSLFAGIGGFDLGLERAGGFKTVAFCEIDPFCQRVLAKHWPDVPRYTDVRELTSDRLAADGIAVNVICGGFPCQDISTAGAPHGERQGLDGERSGLWSEIARLVGELRPRYLIVENVSALLSGPRKSGKWFSRILADLASIGYNAEWENIPAAALGARHGRERVWLVAYPDSLDVEGVAQIEILGFGNIQRCFSDGGPPCFPELPSVRGAGLHGTFNGIPDQVDRLRVIGNAVVPQIPELIGRAILAAERPA